MTFAEAIQALSEGKRVRDVMTMSKNRCFFLRDRTLMEANKLHPRGFPSFFYWEHVQSKRWEIVP